MSNDAIRRSRAVNSIAVMPCHMRQKHYGSFAASKPPSPAAYIAPLAAPRRSRMDEGVLDLSVGPSLKGAPECGEIQSNFGQLHGPRKRGGIGQKNEAIYHFVYHDWRYAALERATQPFGAKTNPADLAGLSG